MGCPSVITIGLDLVFSITTHDPDTAILTDADAPPTYRIYEVETAVPILTGTLAKLDDANTTGFYTEQIACTIGNGFEATKSYTIYIEATVALSTGGITYNFLVTNPVAAFAFPAGAIIFTYTVTNAVTTLPLEGVQVWIATDLAGTNIIWSGLTDIFGVARDVNNNKPLLDAGTYYFFRQKSGFLFVDPDIEAVA